MDTVRVVQDGSGVGVAAKVAVADSWWRRLRGLLGRPRLGNDEGMLLLGCSSVHTVGMRYAIDVAFLDKEGRVVRSIAGLEPLKVGIGGEDAAHALELPAGRLAETGTTSGVLLSWS
ncbi:MAG: DUF192 domain-containing protein [Longimicrobiales bacterium]|nr:DUF192 domain-containing protein [Longimicrobiales bacterium]